MSKLRRILFMVLVSLVIFGGTSAVMAQNYFEPINLRSAGLSTFLSEADRVTSYYDQSNWYPQITPVKGNTFLVFSGNYYYDNYSSNDYAYYAWQGGEETNYSWQQIKDGDILYFTTYTEKTPGCGLSLKFTDNSWLSTDYKDQDGVEAKNSNFRAEGKWYQRRVDLSGLAGKTIKNLALVQENNRYNGELFRCYFDQIEIINNRPVPVYYNYNEQERRYYQNQNDRNYQTGTRHGHYRINRVEAVYVAPQPVCSDSDGGNNIFISGTTDNRVNGLGSYVQDVCVSKDLVSYNNWQYNERSSCYGINCFVKEGYCDGHKVTNTMVSCAYGCQSGVCLNR